MSHASVAGKNFLVLPIGGKNYTLRPMKIGSYAELQAYYLSLRDDPLVLAARATSNPQIPPTAHAAIWDSAMRVASSMRIIPPGEMSAFENSVHGLAFKFYKSIQEDHPEIKSPDEILPLFESIGEEDFAALQAALSVVNEALTLKNSSGPEGTGTQEKEAGPPFTATSPSNSDGPPTK